MVDQFALRTSPPVPPTDGSTENTPYPALSIKHGDLNVVAALKLLSMFAREKFSSDRKDGARDFRDYRGAQEVKNLSAISGYFAGDCVANRWHFMDGRSRNFTQNARPINGGPNA